MPAAARRADGEPLLATFRNGLVEQGATASPLLLPSAPYLRDLADAERAIAEGPPRTARGLMPPERLRTLYDDQARPPAPPGPPKLRIATSSSRIAPRGAGLRR